ncbi:MAG: GtrA family protein [Paracoccaceae bacterium]|nr:GtrA family protein [Paracoccaceae bacterium]
MTGHEPRTSGLAHWLGFLVSGGTAFVTDAGVLKLLLWLTPMSPLVCRLFSIATAMVVGWQMQRRFTFGLKTPGTIREFLQFASVAWTSSAVNYGLFAGLLMVLPGRPVFLSMFLSSGLAMVVSYLGYRLYVFRGGRR